MSGDFRSGFVAVFGRPNVGKSTLVNALVGRKVSIVSDHPQTTRRRITGVVDVEGCQVVLLDLPGFQKPFDSLTRRMQSTVDDALAEVDAALVMLNATETFGGGDRYVVQAVAGAALPAFVALNKIDLVDGPRLGARLEEARRLAGGRDVLAVSAKRGDGLGDVLAWLAAATSCPYRPGVATASATCCPGWPPPCRPGRSTFPTARRATSRWSC